MKFHAQNKIWELFLLRFLLATANLITCNNIVDLVYVEISRNYLIVWWKFDIWLTPRTLTHYIFVNLIFLLCKQSEWNKSEWACVSIITVWGGEMLKSQWNMQTKNKLRNSLVMHNACTWWIWLCIRKHNLIYISSIWYFLEFVIPVSI